jgi:hypothetical protein
LVYIDKGQVEVPNKGGFAVGGNIVPGFVLPEATAADANVKQVGEYYLGTSELPWTGLVIKEGGI